MKAFRLEPTMSFSSDADILAKVNSYVPAVTQFRTDVVGYSHVLLSFDKCRFAECSIGKSLYDLSHNLMIF